MRVDKWLWTARLFKTRSLAAAAVKGGRVHVDGVAAKPSREVGPGDEIEVTIGATRRTVIVHGAAERRVSATEAAKLYQETRRASRSATARPSCAGSPGQPTSAGARPSATGAGTTPAATSERPAAERP
jgi:ribosome-associated heat shock protein Hsp15